MGLNMEEIEKLYFEGAKGILPFIKFSSSFSLGSDSLRNIQLSSRKELFESFIENNIEDNYIHYTSIQSFCEIINSGYIRMYNCDNLNDPKEIEYALDKFGLKTTNYYLDNYKRSHFVFSSCVYDKSKKDDFNMWRLYGVNGEGIGIVYKIEYGDEDYKNLGFHIGKVNYGEKNQKMNLFKKYMAFHIDFNKKYNLFNNTPSLFPLIATFFKDDIWEIENESRITTSVIIDEFGNIDKNILNGIYNSYLIETVETTINNKAKKVYYVKLPLKIKNNTSKILEICPKIKIEKVIFGYNVSEKTRDNLKDFIDYNLSKKLGYCVGYEDSKINE